MAVNRPESEVVYSPRTRVVYVAILKLWQPRYKCYTRSDWSTVKHAQVFFHSNSHSKRIGKETIEEDRPLP